jgi:opine dehydrogenase
VSVTVSIMGAGHCGCAFAADLLNRGASVLLYAHPQHQRNIHAIRQQGHLASTGAIRGCFSPRLSTSIAEAVQFSRYLVVTVPAYGHDAIIAELAKFDLRDHIVLCITGNFFSLVAQRHLNALAVVETATSPFASRVVDGEVNVMGIKKVLPTASLPIDLPLEHRAQLQALFSMPLEWRANVLEIGLMCITGVIHPPPMLMNAGWIESSGGNFYFYREGMSPSVVKVIEEVDAERQHIARRFGLDTRSMLELMNAYYGESYESFEAFARQTAEHNSVRVTPPSLRSRFVDQDVPYVLVPWLELGHKVGLHCPTIEAIIRLASIVRDTDYREVGRNLRSLGMHAAAKDEILVMAGLPALKLAS